MPKTSRTKGEECTCTHICVGMVVTESRNLSTDCPIHGEEAERREAALFHPDRYRKDKPNG